MFSGENVLLEKCQSPRGAKQKHDLVAAASLCGRQKEMKLGKVKTL
jgi:hypothetical protein